MTTTYEPIATTTLGSAQSSVTFSSISGSFTDLVLIFDGTLNTGSANLNLRLNADTGTNYSFTNLTGSGAGTYSARNSNQTAIETTNYAYLEVAGRNNAIINLQNYSNTTTNKTVIARTNNAANGVTAAVGLWRNTSAVNSITVLTSGNSFASGSTFTLYGIKAE